MNFIVIGIVILTNSVGTNVGTSAQDMEPSPVVEPATESIAMIGPSRVPSRPPQPPTSPDTSGDRPTEPMEEEPEPGCTVNCLDDVSQPAAPNASAPHQPIREHVLLAR